VTALSWREARDLLTERGYGANDAQQILDDLAWFAWSGKRFSVLAGGEARWLRYDNASCSARPYYLLEAEVAS
jgi:hypothetical protein